MVGTGKGNDEDDDETFYHRYATPSSTSKRGGGGGGGGGGSGGLAPSKSTVYVSNLDFSLTNSDLFTIFSTFGKVARVTVLKDPTTRKSKGVAFILFVSRYDALSAANSMNSKILNGRVLRASIANDNGRAPEFIRRRVYKDKSRCYECGQDGHLSYECPNNQLGPRERPLPKKARRDKEQLDKVWDYHDDDYDDAGIQFDDDNWASVVDNDADHRLLMAPTPASHKGKQVNNKRPSYFSDESDQDD